jgi:hypothetical protein
MYLAAALVSQNPIFPSSFFASVHNNNNHHRYHNTLYCIARQAGGFSDSRVLVAAELLAGAFSDNSISEKTKKMQVAIAKVRTVVKELQAISTQALTGDEKTSGGGGFFGMGAKKTDPAALAKQAKQLYVEGGNAWNEYVAAANDSLALKFDRFNYIS